MDNKTYFDPETSGTPWPQFVRPFKDEVISSWLLRLAWSHNYKIWSFIHYLDLAIPLNRDLDRHLPSEFIDYLSIKTHTPTSQINTMLLSSYFPNLECEVLPVKTTNKWILPLKLEGRQRKGYWTMACPRCLEEDIPYFKKSWRNALYFACLKHGTLLIDRCQNCHQPINYWRHDLGIKKPTPDFSKCSFCFYPLNQKAQNLSSKQLRIQKKIDQLLQFGYDRNYNYSHLFFEGLYFLLNLLRSNSKHLHNLQKGVGIRSKIDLIYPYPKVFFNKLSIDQRLNLLEATFWLLQKWQNRLLKEITTSNLSYARLVRYFDDLPYWLYKILKYETNKNYDIKVL